MKTDRAACFSEKLIEMYDTGRRRLPEYHVLSRCVRLHLFFSFWLCSPARAMASSSTKFLDHMQHRVTVGKTPLDE
jgi:hypothetical protein